MRASAHSPTGQHSGCTLRHERTLIAAEWSLQRFPGDLVEIGVLEGVHTLRLAKLAEQYGRRIIAVDPWNNEKEYPWKGGCKSKTEENFYSRMGSYLRIVDVLGDYSQSVFVTRYIKDRAICFGYIDGAHAYEPCKTDIDTLWHCNGIIALDDLWMKGVKQAFLEAGKRPEREAWFCEELAEGYLLKC